MTSVVRQLRAWQTLESTYSAALAVAALLGVMTVGLFAACLTDWLFDRYRDTPLWLRAALTGTQVVVYTLVGAYAFYRIRRPSLDGLAVKAEAAIPEFGHRLVTSLQLNRPTARTEGMSSQLIGLLTDEAEAIAKQHRLTKLVDFKPLLWAAGILLLVVIAASAIILYNSNLAMVLLKRQLLLSVDIPRTLEVDNATPELLPAGDAVELNLRVTGPIDEATVGNVLLTPLGQPTEQHEARFTGRFADGAARFTVQLPPTSEPFRFTARIGDGRMRRPVEIRFEARPIVTKQDAWVLLPTYVDPKGMRHFERYQQQGEIVAQSDASVRVLAETSKKVAHATLSVLGRGENAEEKILYSKPMTLGVASRIVTDKNGIQRTEEYFTTEHTFDLTSLVRPTGYRIEVNDENGFANLNPPRRGITITADDPPIVQLLDELIGFPRLVSNKPIADQLEGYQARGLPIQIDNKVIVGYRARSQLGIKSAEIVYRVNEGDWAKLPLSPVVANTEKVGRFIPEVGLFETYDDFGQVELYMIPAANPDDEPDGLEAGGRYNFQTAGLKKRGPDGKLTKLEVGDRVEMYVAVYDRKPDRSSSKPRPAGVSESRLKTVLSDAQFQDWIRQNNQSIDRLRRIEEAQRGVFGQKTQPQP